MRVALLAVMLAARLPLASADKPLRFGRDVLPILSANCFSCHGPDESQRKAGLRLDLESEAKRAYAGGVPVVAGNLSGSLLVQRITSADPDLLMPPPDSHRTLTEAQKAILQQWISEGAGWGRHWSFESPLVAPGVPSGSAGIDRLVEMSLSEHGLQPGPAADRYALIRRLSLDLTGLPPAEAEAEAFVGSSDPRAVEQLVDALLAREEFGEHWARMWLDLARYADTKGYEKDLGRTMWPWRDWLVRSLNQDLPLDVLTEHLLAGDLLPAADDQQRLATAFHRNTMSNDEGGTDDEEFRSIAVKDRVDTTLQVWMGLTAGCAKCHSHKYDPISMTDYYSLYAIFNQTEDADRYDDAPILELLDEQQRRKRSERRARQADLRRRLEESRSADAAGDDQGWRVLSLQRAESQGGAMLKSQADGSVVVSGVRPAEDVYTVILELPAGPITALRLQALPGSGANIPGVGRNGTDPNFVLSELEAELVTGGQRQRLQLVRPRADFEQSNWPAAAALDGDLKTGWAISPRQREPHVAIFELSQPLQLSAMAELRLVMRQHYGNSLTFRQFRWSVHGGEATGLQPLQASEKTRELQSELSAVEQQLNAVLAGVLKVPVLSALPADRQCETRIHRRGNFLDPGDLVQPALPAELRFGFVMSETPTRLEVAHWLMSPGNPLTPRVWSNRIWARLFGEGLVETEEDFGSLGSLPSNPELLDFLAVQYRENGWSLKRLLKLIVLSRVYGQDSAVTEQLRQQDPGNVLLSRGARYRLSAEVLRDQMLAVSGRLSLKRGGPPVMPPQPDGLWRSTYNGQKWVNAEGEDRYRRGMYTYLKRTTPHPMGTTFDGGSGEVCQIRRIRTNTPLQALVTLNDPTSLECAGGLAEWMSRESEGRLERGLRRALIRPGTRAEVAALEGLLSDVRLMFEERPEQAEALLSGARVQRPDSISQAEFAGLVVVASTILNLDEFLSRR
ncbi:MAG: DUF1553 domain-containing protein [Planctomycetaceae bacterium]